METISYKLKSNTEKTLTIPQSLVDGAKRLMADTLKADDANDLALRIQKYDELKHYPILSEALRLRSYLVKGQWCGRQEFLKTEDSLYLKYCLYNMYDLVKESKKIEHNEDEHNGLLNMMIPIMNTIRSLEEVDDGGKK